MSRLCIWLSACSALSWSRRVGSPNADHQESNAPSTAAFERITAVKSAPPGPSTSGERSTVSRCFAVVFYQASKPFFQLSQPIIVVLRL